MDGSSSANGSNLMEDGLVGIETGSNCRRCWGCWGMRRRAGLGGMEGKPPLIPGPLWYVWPLGYVKPPDRRRVVTVRSAEGTSDGEDSAAAGIEYPRPGGYFSDRGCVVCWAFMLIGWRTGAGDQVLDVKSV